MFFSLVEFRDIIVMSAALGFIFHDIFRKPKVSYSYDPLTYFKKYRFNWEDFFFAMAITAPAVILHELGHKFVALSFGASAMFHAAFLWLFIGIMLKLMNFGFIFFVPAYVSISSQFPLHPLQYSLIAVAGPAVNLILFITANLLLRIRKFSTQTTVALVLTKRINLLLFIFNMLPLPGFDGFKVYYGIFQAIFH